MFGSDLYVLFVIAVATAPVSSLKTVLAFSLHIETGAFHDDLWLPVVIVSRKAESSDSPSLTVSSSSSSADSSTIILSVGNLTVLEKHWLA